MYCDICRHWKRDGPQRGTCAVWRMMTLGPASDQTTEHRGGEYPDEVTSAFRPSRNFGCIRHEHRLE